MKHPRLTTNWDDVPVVMDLPYAARILALTPETLIKRAKKGEFPAYKEGKVWRVRKDSFIAHIERMEQGVSA